MRDAGDTGSLVFAFSRLQAEPENHMETGLKFGDRITDEPTSKEGSWRQKSRPPHEAYGRADLDARVGRQLSKRCDPRLSSSLVEGICGSKGLEPSRGMSGRDAREGSRSLRRARYTPPVIAVNRSGVGAVDLSKRGSALRVQDTL